LSFPRTKSLMMMHLAKEPIIQCGHRVIIWVKDKSCLDKFLHRHVLPIFANGLKWIDVLPFRR
jgi:hypothetical protein